MFVKKTTPAQLQGAMESLKEAFGRVCVVDDAPVKEYMIKWLSAFAPDMSFYDAKSFCLPRRMYKNYLWHAFSFQKTDCFAEDDARDAFENGFEGECYVLLNDENLLCTVPDGRVFSWENVKSFKNIVIFTKDYERTYVNTGSEEFGPYYKSSNMESLENYEPQEESSETEE